MDKEAEIRRLDHSRRASNLETYNPDGTVKKGPKQGKKSKTYLKTQTRLAELWRLAAHQKTLHGRMVNEALRMGNVFTEDVRQFGERSGTGEVRPGACPQG